MATTLQNIPTFVLEHKWSSDIESIVYSDLEDNDDRVSLTIHSKPNNITSVFHPLSYNFYNFPPFLIFCDY